MCGVSWFTGLKRKKYRIEIQTDSYMLCSAEGTANYMYVISSLARTEVKRCGVVYVVRCVVWCGVVYVVRCVVWCGVVWYSVMWCVVWCVVEWCVV
jgi:hypothetical protein